MNALLRNFINLFTAYDIGTLADFPDPPAPSDLGDPLTQDEIDFVKSLRKEMQERFPDNTCGAEKTGVAITDTDVNNFTIEWINPAGYLGTTIHYREEGSPTWLFPNDIGAATGTSISSTEYALSGLAADVSYEVRIQNTCANSVVSDGVFVVATAVAP